MLICCFLNLNSSCLSISHKILILFLSFLSCVQLKYYKIAISCLFLFRSFYFVSLFCVLLKNIKLQGFSFSYFSPGLFLSFFSCVQKLKYYNISMFFSFSYISSGLQKLKSKIRHFFPFLSYCLFFHLLQVCKLTTPLNLYLTLFALFCFLLFLYF